MNFLLISYLLLFAIDRISKWYALNNFNEQTYMHPLISFETVLNKGISWGMLSQAGGLITWALPLVIIMLILFFVRHTIISFLNGNTIIGELFVLIGGISNIMDRFLYGGVVDFILFSYNQWSFPVFNLADVYIVFGIFIILLANLKS